MSHEYNIISSTRNNIRNRIRRQQIQSYFQLRRTQALQQLQKNIQKVIIGLYDQQQRILFLKEIQNQLSSSEPNIGWQLIINSLDQDILRFQDSFDLWIRYSIIDILSSSMKIKYFNLNIQYKILKLFAKTIIYSKKQQNLYFINHFFQLNYVQDYIIYQKSISLPIQQALEFLHFFSNLSSISESIRKSLLQMGVGQIIVDMGSAILDRPYEIPQQILFNYLGYTSQFLRIFTSNCKNTYPDINFVLQVIERLSHFMHLTLNEKIINQCLTCFTLILKQKVYKVHQPLLQTQSVITKIFYFLKCKPYQQKALNCISFLCIHEHHGKFKFIRDMHLLDILYDINCQVNIKNSIRILTSNVISNLIFNNQQSNYLIVHPLWKIICSYISYNYSFVKQEALHCILNTLNWIDSQQIKKSIFNIVNFIPLIIDQIVLTKEKHYAICSLALQLIYQYILAYTEQDSQQNIAVSNLQSVFKFSDLLESILNDNKSAQLVDKASKMIDFLINRFVTYQTQ